jgi:hypothetical protein
MAARSKEGAKSAMLFDEEATVSKRRLLDTFFSAVLVFVA